jgi:hypothetical protein
LQLSLRWDAACLVPFRMSSETSGLLHWPFVLWQAHAGHQHVRFLGEVLVARPARMGAQPSASRCDERPVLGSPHEWRAEVGRKRIFGGDPNHYRRARFDQALLIETIKETTRTRAAKDTNSMKRRPVAGTMDRVRSQPTTRDRRVTARHRLAGRSSSDPIDSHTQPLTGAFGERVARGRNLCEDQGSPDLSVSSGR